MPSNKIIAVIFALSLFSVSAHAGIEKGDKTVSIFGSFTSPDIGEDILFVQAAGGMFLSDKLEGQGTVSLIDSGPFRITNFGGNANFYFPNKNPDLIPYAGGGLALSLIEFGATDETELGFNLQAGLKQFLSEEISINYQLQLVDAGDFDATIFSVGFSIFIE